jgi:hypothetical protein
MNKQTIADMELAGKRVLIRADLNVPGGFRRQSGVSTRSERLCYLGSVDRRKRSQHAEVRERGEWSR